MTDDDWMRYALRLAAKAQAQGEVPVGAVLIREQQVLGEGWNQPITLHDASAHAEMLAIRAAGQLVSNYRLPNTTLYVTLEPCAMCVGAMIHARIQRLVFGAFDPKTGAVLSTFKLLTDMRHNHQIEVVAGLLETECADMLKAFFRARRQAQLVAKQTT